MSTRFVVTIAVRNAENYIERALRSAVQDYPHYRIIISDDASVDSTWDIACKVSEQLSVDVTLLRQEKRLGVVGNHYSMSQSIDDDEVIVILDGDDQLYGSNVLSKLAEVYSDPDVWITYGSFGYDEESRNPAPGASWRGFAAQMNHYDRRASFSCTHLRTYKRWLFNRIRLEDLKYGEDFYQWICDHVTMYPMIEMAGPKHSRYINDILYLYNAASVYNEHKGPGNYPDSNPVLAQIKREAELRIGHSNVSNESIINNMTAHFKSLPAYPRLENEKDYPYKEQLV